MSQPGAHTQDKIWRRIGLETHCRTIQAVQIAPNSHPGTVIPLVARIISLADTFDAMTSDRPYRKRLTLDDAAREITACAGTQFDRV